MMMMKLMMMLVMMLMMIMMITRYYTYSLTNYTTILYHQITHPSPILT